MRIGKQHLGYAAIAWMVAAVHLAGCPTDGNGDADTAGDGSSDAADSPSELGDGQPADPALDSVVDLASEADSELEREIDESLIGVWSFRFANAAGSTFTPEWVDRSTPTHPFQQMRVAGAYTFRPDGSWSLLHKQIWRETPEAQGEIDPPVDGPEDGEWWIDGDVLTFTIEPDFIELEWEYDYDESTGLLVLEATGGALNRPDLWVMQRESIDPELLGAWLLESLLLDDDTRLTTENQTVVTSDEPPVSYEARVSGRLRLGEDGMLERQVTVWIDDEEVSNEDVEGLWFVRDGILRYEEPVVDIISWSYSVDSTDGRLTQAPQGTWNRDFTELVWTSEQ